MSSDIIVVPEDDCGLEAAAEDSLNANDWSSPGVNSFIGFDSADINSSAGSEIHFDNEFLNGPGTDSPSTDESAFENREHEGFVPKDAPLYCGPADTSTGFDSTLPYMGPLFPSRDPSYFLNTIPFTSTSGGQQTSYVEMYMDSYPNVSQIALYSGFEHVVRDAAMYKKKLYLSSFLVGYVLQLTEQEEAEVRHVLCTRETPEAQLYMFSLFGDVEFYDTTEGNVTTESNDITKGIVTTESNDTTEGIDTTESNGTTKSNVTTESNDTTEGNDNKEELRIHGGTPAKIF